MTQRGEVGQLTQRQVAERAGVSQATVSLVLNGKADASTRIPKETRARVEKILRETGYVANPAARRLAGLGNKIVGVFTYEPAFPSEGQDFYAPLLNGIESSAEELGCDLLLFTSAPVVDGTRRLLHENNRLRLADGCLLLGREMNRDELQRLTETGFPVVSVGRRDLLGVPYVGIDYAGGTSELVSAACEWGHRSFVYLHVDSQGESGLDRRAGLLDELERRGMAPPRMHPMSAANPVHDWALVKASKASVLVVESHEHATAVTAIARAEGVRIPEDLSVLVLSDAARPAGPLDFTRISPPRRELGAAATRLLARLLDPDDVIDVADLRSMLDCPAIPGTTLAAPSKGIVA